MKLLVILCIFQILKSFSPKLLTEIIHISWLIKFFQLVSFFTNKCVTTTVPLGTFICSSKAGPGFTNNHTTNRTCIFYLLTFSYFYNEEQIISDCPIDGAISVRVDGGFGSYRWFVYITTLLLQDASWILMLHCGPTEPHQRHLYC